MSAPLPDLPTDPELDVRTEVSATTVRGRLLWVFSYRLPETASRGRRYRLRWDTGHAVRVLFRLADRTACRPADSAEPGDRFTVSLQALATKRQRGIPADLRTALHDAQVTLDALPAAHVQQLVLMVTEAHDSAIRAERIRIAVDAARAAAR